MIYKFQSPIIAAPIPIPEPESAFQSIAPRVAHYYYYDDSYDYPYDQYKHARPSFGGSSTSTSSFPPTPFPSTGTSTPPPSTAAAPPPFPTGTGAFPTRTPIFSFSTRAPAIPTTPPAPFATGRA